MYTFLVFLYEYLNSLKWVLLIGGTFFCFRSEIKSILNRTLVVKHKDTSFEFRAQTESKNDESAEIQEIERTNSEIELLEIIQQKDVETADATQQILKLTLEKHFEYTYRLIFRSQIYLLQSLQSFIDGLSVLQVEQHLEDTKKVFEVFNTWTIDLYLKFLFDQNLIQKDVRTGKITLTNIGDTFLKYLIVSNYNYNNEKSL